MGSEFLVTNSWFVAAEFSSQSERGFCLVQSCVPPSDFFSSVMFFSVCFLNKLGIFVKC